DERVLAIRVRDLQDQVVLHPAGTSWDVALPRDPSEARLERARGGEPTARLRTLDAPLAGSPGVEEVVHVLVPVRDQDGQVVGTAEVVQDRTEAAAAMREAVRLLGMAVTAGLLGFWLVLFRTARATSRSLQRSVLENHRLAHLDSLTGLPNRRMLLDRLDRAVASRRPGGGVGLLLLDLDRFKEINDTLGHDQGDELLVQVSGRLMDVFRGRDLVARLGGDEFAVLLPGAGSVQDAEQLARRARAVFGTPFDLGGMHLHVDTSIGVAVLPDHAVDARELMRKADVAMYTAKHQRLGVAVYSAEDDGTSPTRLVLVSELHRALSVPGELVMHYQPKIDLVSGRTVGLEALMRWDHPRRGRVDPQVFIPLAERSGLIDDLTDLALTTVVRQIARWGVHAAVPVGVNLSARCITSRDLVPGLLSLLADHGVPAELLEIEITESALVERSRVLPVLRDLAGAGIQVTIDDFGVGSTSISQLRELPVGALKIDSVFVEDLAAGPDPTNAASVVKAMVDLGHSFGMRVVAEGVEHEETARRLSALGVDEAQGFWYSPALSAADIVRPQDAVVA
ncbi:putative bifunctional diguanylate cyclase/phosphodiesterase, partial [Cellulomonas bogoriensis]|uniref:putative bifunctional diguanylate cyclase/phosphodiesterase n=1 Tax=Cellulomonas bogoriensis TaxID=301388 RepID=UPI00068D8BC7